MLPNPSEKNIETNPVDVGSMGTLLCFKVLQKNKAFTNHRWLKSCMFVCRKQFFVDFTLMPMNAKYVILEELWGAFNKSVICYKMVSWIISGNKDPLFHPWEYVRLGSTKGNGISWLGQLDNTGVSRVTQLNTGTLMSHRESKMQLVLWVICCPNYVACFIEQRC